MAANKTRLSLEYLADRTVPALLGGGNAAVDFDPPTTLTVPQDREVEVNAAAEAGLTISTEAPGGRPS